MNKILQLRTCYPILWSRGCITRLPGNIMYISVVPYCYKDVKFDSDISSVIQSEACQLGLPYQQGHAVTILLTVSAISAVLYCYNYVSCDCHKSSAMLWKVSCNCHISSATISQVRKMWRPCQHCHAVTSLQTLTAAIRVLCCHK
jgi:hypothetical protein